MPPNGPQPIVGIQYRGNYQNPGPPTASMPSMHPSYQNPHQPQDRPMAPQPYGMQS